MKKRNLLLLVCILLAVALVMVSCGKKNSDEAPHQHSFANVYSSDATGHWYAATCEHTDAKLGFVAHSDSDKNGLCDVCNYVTCAHTYDTSVWVSDETNHWHAASCGCNVISDSAAHADADKNGKCDTCDYVTCEHTYADEYTYDDNGHWLAYTCGCALTPEVLPHADENKDGKCDACEYVLCNHNPEENWTSDINSHWHASDCDCIVKIDEDKHTYEDGSYVCAVCGYECTHDLADEWTSDENGHWHSTVCGHEADAFVEEHIDDNKDGACDVCKWEDPNHTHTWAVGTNKHQHYAYTTCEHVIAKNFVNHEDADGDGKCDTCSASTVGITDVIDSITSKEAAAKVNGGVVYSAPAETLVFTYDNGSLVIDDIFWQGMLTLTPENAITATEITTAVLAGNWNGDINTDWGDYYGYTVTINEDGTGTLYYTTGYSSYNYEILSVTVDEGTVSIDVIQPSAVYTLYKTFSKYVIDGTDFYLSSYLNNGVPSIFKIAASEWGFENNSAYADYEELNGPRIGIMYDYVNAYGIEGFIYALYEIANSEEQVIFNLVESYDEANGVIYFSFARLNADEWGDSVQVYTATITVENGAITSAVVTADEYMSGSYYADAENGVFIPYADAESTMSYEVKVIQTVGEREDAVNPYAVEDLLILELHIFNEATGEEIKEGDIVEIGIGDENRLYITLPEADVEKAPANEIILTAYDEFGFETYDISASHWSYPYSVCSYNKAGDYTVTVSSIAGGSVTFTARFIAKAPTALQGAVVVDGTKNEATEVTTYPGVNVTVSAIAPAADQSTETIATVTAGNADAVTIIQNGENWIVSASEVGTYTITLTSALDENISTTVKLVVNEAPSAAEILNGKWSFLDGYGEEIYLVFTPESEGATNGVVEIAFNNNDYYDPIEFKETANYSYADGVITLTHKEGDGLDLVSGIEITSDYNVNLIVLLNPYFPADFYLERVEENGGNEGGDDVGGENVALADLVGTWSGSETGGIMALTHKWTINSDGTGTGIYNDGWDRTFNITATVVEGNTVMIFTDYRTTDGTKMLTFTYSNGTLSCANGGFYNGAITITKDTNSGNGNGGSVEVDLSMLEGTWTGEEFGRGGSATYSITINTNGTGEGYYTTGIGPGAYNEYFSIVRTEIENGTVKFVIVFTADLESMEYSFTCTYEEDGSLFAAAGLNMGQLMLTNDSANGGQVG